MTDSRQTILGTIRRSLGRTEDATRPEAVRARLAEAPRGVVPKRAQIPHEDQIVLFMKQAEGVSATVERVAESAELPARIATFLRERNLPQSLVHGGDPLLSGLPWDQAPGLDRKQGRAEGGEQNGLSRAFGGVAETGTLVMASGPDNPTTVNFLPENHIVAMRAEDIAGDYEAVLGRVREAYGKGHMPRVLNMITGPSRSADIQQTLLLGAHGPRRLHIIIVG